jgi:hypothetical protein
MSLRLFKARATVDEDGHRRINRENGGIWRRSALTFVRLISE